MPKHDKVKINWANGHTRGKSSSSTFVLIAFISFGLFNIFHNPSYSLCLSSSLNEEHAVPQHYPCLAFSNVFSYILLLFPSPFLFFFPLFSLSLSLPCFCFVLIVNLHEKLGKGLSSPIGGPREELEQPKFSQALFFSPSPSFRSLWLSCARLFGKKAT